MITKEDGTQIFVLEQTGQEDVKERQHKIDIRNQNEIEEAVKKTAEGVHKSNIAAVNAAVEHSTRMKGMRTAMASFVGLEDDQLKDATEKHEDGMPTFACACVWLEVDELEKEGGEGACRDPDPYQLAYAISWEGSREDTNGNQESQEDTKVNFIIM